MIYYVKVNDENGETLAFFSGEMISILRNIKASFTEPNNFYYQYSQHETKWYQDCDWHDLRYWIEMESPRMQFGEFIRQYKSLVDEFWTASDLDETIETTRKFKNLCKEFPEFAKIAQSRTGTMRQND